MKRSIFSRISLFLFSLFLFACSVPVSPEAAQTAAPTIGVEPTFEPSPEPAVEPGGDPVADYDAKKHILTVTGTEHYDRLALPAGADAAVTLRVEDDDFRLSAYIPNLPLGGEGVSDFLPAFLFRTNESFRFLRTYLQENCESVCPADRAALPVVLDANSLKYGYRVREDRIELTDNGCDFMHCEFLYLLALIKSDSVGWEQFGYAWYVGTCIDPYNECLKALLVPEAETFPYVPLLINADIDLKNMTPRDMRTLYDAVSRVSLEQGLTHWGSTCESLPVTKEPGFSRKSAGQNDGDQLLSAFMAASFIGWLDDQYGFETVSAFCFGQKGFDEAFGTDFDTAFGAWKEWIMKTYPM